MAKESLNIVITFHTTSEALAMKKCGSDHSLMGRLAPIPRQISAGCGFAWCEPSENEDQLMKVIEDECIEYENINVLSL